MDKEKVRYGIEYTNDIIGDALFRVGELVDEAWPVVEDAAGIIKDVRQAFRNLHDEYMNYQNDNATAEPGPGEQVETEENLHKHTPSHNKNKYTVYRRDRPFTV